MSGIIPITLLTGFLGSGKTTLLTRVLADPRHAATAVIVNELADIGLDRALIAAVRGNVIEMTTGCLCCSAGGDVTHALVDLARRAEHYEISPFNRVVIETTGIADPAPLVPTLMLDARITARYRLTAILTTVDAILGDPMLDRHDEARRQVMLADWVAVTKSDLAVDRASKAELARLVERIGVLNGTARIVDVHDPDADLHRLFDGGPLGHDPVSAMRWLAAQPRRLGAASPVSQRSTTSSPHASGIAATSLSWSEPVEQSRFLASLETLARRLTPRVLRIKGLIATRENPERPLVVHGVGPYLSPPVRLERWPDIRRDSRLVVIADGVAESEIRDLLDLDQAAQHDPARRAAR